MAAKFRQGRQLVLANWDRSATFMLLYRPTTQLALQNGCGKSAVDAVNLFMKNDDHEHQI
jgi:hypothetical protein